MSGRPSAKSKALHYALEALPDGGAHNIKVLTRDKMRSCDVLPHWQQPFLRRQNTLWQHLKQD